MPIGVKPMNLVLYPYRARAPVEAARPGPEWDDRFVNISWVPVRGIREWGFNSEYDLNQFLTLCPKARKCTPSQ